ncbi:hypothetical protein TIFTF001_027596 [Ficus carica]|uniref:Uncharacterized protein n=1 Tax=Ficus carica TaxID=3494 RepID=A0AA88DNB0_FICCA|nr:hypothetical protein TIFTF001_027596 [Ficus carica]
MTCPFLVVASHMWKVMLALASQVSNAKGLLTKARSTLVKLSKIGLCGGTLLVQAQQLAK